MSLTPTSRLNAFALLDCALLAAVALKWGASFLMIDFGLDALHPATVAWLRLVLGYVTLAAFPAARPPCRAESPWRTRPFAARRWCWSALTLQAVGSIR